MALNEQPAKDNIVAALEEARDRSLALLAPIPAQLLERQHSALMSPLAWDLAHIAHYEELWLLRNLVGTTTGDVAHRDEVYDAFKHPRSERAKLELLTPDEARQFAADVRKRVLDVLTEISLDPNVPLLHDGFVYGMVVRHEHQHNETMLAAIQLMDDYQHPAAPSHTAATASVVPEPEVLIDGGPFVMGTSTDRWAYDNERPAHTVDVAPFLIDTTAVTNGAYLEFIAAGGYDDPRWWTDRSWAWRVEAGLEHPEFWSERADGAWWVRRFGRMEPIRALEPVQHVCWYEADAYARWRGKRLPTETEWEKAASWDAARAVKHRFPWGDEAPTPEHSDLSGDARSGPDEVGAHPTGASPSGCLGMVGGVWEWTSSDFDGYPGFDSFPYREYSEVFFASAESQGYSEGYSQRYKVLRGGSWATHANAVSTTFRNWDLPIRRQIFAGFRCARDLPDR